jgi:lysophospholipase L1-like esterase
MSRIILLGDSIIDNGAYVRKGEPDVTKQLQARLPRRTVIMRAVDGAVAANVLASQVNGLESSDHVILSVGGNDALQHKDILENAGLNAGDVLLRFWTIREEFRKTYTALLDRLAATKAKVMAMTIYNPNFSDYGVEFQRMAESGVSTFNDVIQQEALARAFDVLELRSLFTDKADYANPIEPSMIGGAKLANAMAEWVENQHRCHLRAAESPQ